MKKIINNKVYDTGTATRVGRASTGAVLYRKRTGEYFIFGEEWILPLTFFEAKSWAAYNLDTDTYLALFGVVAEDGRRVTITLSMRADTVDALRRAASKDGRTLSAYAESAVRTAILWDK